jgi:hypothetical protein
LSDDDSEKPAKPLREVMASRGSAGTAQAEMAASPPQLIWRALMSASELLWRFPAEPLLPTGSADMWDFNWTWDADRDSLAAACARTAARSPGVLPRRGVGGGLFADSAGAVASRPGGVSKKDPRRFLRSKERAILLRATSRERMLDVTLLRWLLAGQPVVNLEDRETGPKGEESDDVPLSQLSRSATGGGRQQQVERSLVPAKPVRVNDLTRGWGLEEMALGGLTDVSTQELLETIRLHGGINLRALDLSAVTELTSNGLRAIMEECPRLESLSLVNCGQLTSVSLDGLPRLRHLTTLRLAGLFDVTEQVIHYIVRCRALRHLDLSDCHMLSSEAVEHLVYSDDPSDRMADDGDSFVGASHGGIATQLQRLDFGHCPLPLPTLMAQIPLFTALQGLSLRANEEVIDSVVERISASCVDLRRIDLAGCIHVSDLALASLAARCSIEAIKVDGCNITDAGLRHLASFCSEPPNRGQSALPVVAPASVDLTDSPVDEKGGVALAGGTGTLAWLSMTGCTKISDEGLAVLAASNQPLRRLVLKGVRTISTSALSALARSPSIAQLLELDVSLCCNVGTEGIREVVSAAPSLSILRAWGQSWGPAVLADLKGCGSPRLRIESTSIA